MLPSDTTVVTLEVPRFYDKQLEFMQSKKRYTAYGGARGGGWMVNHSLHVGKQHYYVRDMMAFRYYY